MKTAIGNNHIALELKKAAFSLLLEEANRGIQACVCSDLYTIRLSIQHSNTSIIAFEPT